MILLLDNYDSFTYNLYQVIGALNPQVRAVRNDALQVAEIAALHPEAIVISPGPGFPKDAGISEELIAKLGPQVPILGVCLGHQAICEVYGAEITYAHKVVHGKSDPAAVDTKSVLFSGLEATQEVARYHSLAVREDTLPPELRITARSCDDAEVMAVEHTRYPVYGVQFHPESIMTPQGPAMLERFLAAAHAL
ncbi:anthranilate synthase component 2 [Actinobaculum suis]|uniref:Aminodeoxychorismate/anthranilate synthase component II n=1 Tax=Actinobaculum suis TaxID=1657 RepID=A0A1B9BAD1_9ACTO|nr:aminodeoxychorismate/anthranilate synthase component II [Actinobaculum suis]MDY5153670.1 aminodeoxychorismate/anthranilate synthase component II [Actinobaculum suis]OCA93033.1 aminodeoxychorismate/anthranilate synthase component II [Actinobaculum suis]OCA93192.1 aminodeoxychorismate/anthranilate synthase component II [Actinobaculum suis]SDE21955.1 anthranilate synthase component 2 [Actinobaculum suis]